MEKQSSDSSPCPEQPLFNTAHLLTVLALLVVVCLSAAASAKLVDRLQRSRGIRTNAAAERFADSARFDGVLAMETVVGGQHDIQVAVVQPAFTQVTRFIDSPANETDPAWSPDGQWLAYLSDVNGRREVYLKRYHERGRVIQLTSDPQITWSGPLHWMVQDRFDPTSGAFTADAWILAKGTAEQSAIYRIPVQETPGKPEMLPATAGISGAYYLSPSLQEIAFEKPGGEVEIARLEAQEGHLITRAETARGMKILPGGFAWLYGDLYAYLVQGEPPVGEVGVEIRKGSWLPDETTRQPLPPDESELYLSGRVSSVRSVLAAFGYSLYVLQDGQLDGTGADGCLRIHQYSFYVRPVPADHQPLLSDACVDLPGQGFNTSHILPVPNNRHYYNARWLVFTGHAPGKSQPALFAALIFENLDLSGYARLRQLPLTLLMPIVPGSISIRLESPFQEGYGYTSGQAIDLK